MELLDGNGREAMRRLEIVRQAIEIWESPELKRGAWTRKMQAFAKGRGISTATLYGWEC